MLTDVEASEIRRKLDQGWRGPALIGWLHRLLDDREERVWMEREIGLRPDSLAHADTDCE